MVERGRQCAGGRRMPKAAWRENGADEGVGDVVGGQDCLE